MEKSLLGKRGSVGVSWREILMVIVLPGVLLGDHVVEIVVPPEGAPHKRGVMRLEMSVAVHL